MYRRTYKNTGEQVSVLGFGCMRLPKLYEGRQDIDYDKAQKLIDYAYEHGVNYFDTAYLYHEGGSETFIGHALKKYERSSFYLASKMPTWLVKSEEDVERYFSEQLLKCQVDYFDFYLVHGLNGFKFDICKKYHIYDILKKKKEEGKIRYLGFSFHDKPEKLEEIIETYEWDFAQIQLNYLDWELQDAKRQYELLEKNNIPCIIMEPVRGGALARLCDKSVEIFKEAEPERSVASWAIRYAATLPNVLTVLSGMSDMDQTVDNVSTMENFKPLREEDYSVIQKAVEAYRENATIPCTGCRYCMDCPAGVDIPKMFALFNQYTLDKRPDQYVLAYDYNTSMQAVHCVSCKKCIEKCPQGIQIPEEMKRITECIEKIR